MGNLRYSAESKLDLPAVGDWVTIAVYDTNKALIYEVIPRSNILKRKAVGKKNQEQIIATNIDFAFIVESVNRDFSLNRFQRYMTICLEALITPILVLNKTDLIANEKLLDLKELVKERFSETQLICTSCANNLSMETIRNKIKTGKTYCFLGSSGVGKSTLINILSGGKLMQTDDISEFSGRGKHTTTFRHLIVLDDGGILIDNPGMREVGMSNVALGIEKGFASISELSNKCKYKDCKHVHENGCAVLKAIDDGVLDNKEYQNYLKLMREQEHFEASELDKKRKGKDLARMVKDVKKHKKLYK